MELSIATAQENYELCKTLPEYTKLRVNQSTGKLATEDRWFSSARRYWGQNSRQCIIDPLRQTFVLMIEEPDLPQVVSHTSGTLTTTYPDDFEFQKSLSKMITEISNLHLTKKKEHPIGRIHETAFVEPAAVRKRIKTTDDGDVVIDFDGIPSEDCSDLDINEKSVYGCYGMWDWFKSHVN